MAVPSAGGWVEEVVSSIICLNFGFSLRKKKGRRVLFESERTLCRALFKYHEHSLFLEGFLEPGRSLCVHLGDINLTQHI